MSIIHEFGIDKEEIMNDLYIMSLSRNLSKLGRTEVHNGRAHFGIFGSGKELPQIVYAKNFKKGDWRSGYYRDQTFMLALGLLQPEEFFSMIYGDNDETFNPTSAGRNFNNHFNTINIDEDGNIENLLEQYNSASDISSTAGQMPRLLGLAQASKIVRENPKLKNHLRNNVAGNEVAFGSIGDASTSEGMFFEAINAAGVLQIPMAVSVYDDGFGISVPVDLQTTKASISEALAGFKRDKGSNGIEIYTCPGWDYEKLLTTYNEGIKLCREQHIPVLFHITELTQPLGHSTSGSHQRYKSKERLQWEDDMDCIAKYKEWIISNDFATKEEVTKTENRAYQRARDAKRKAWQNYQENFKKEERELNKIINTIDLSSSAFKQIKQEFKTLSRSRKLLKIKYVSLAKQLYYVAKKNKVSTDNLAALKDWINKTNKSNQEIYAANLYREGKDSALNVKRVPPEFPKKNIRKNGSEILNENFDKLFEKYPNLVSFGEDVGYLGGVNQGMKGMQKKYGKHRVFDTGIRETTIIGQGIGLALRGFRPIAEIQYLDYLNYAHSTLSDDLATLQYRSKGRQAAPVIVRTRGHQLQGIWHAGSPMQMLLGSMKGIYLCVPRSMLQAAGMYNTLLQANDPALVIEPLKAYGVKEQIPSNLGEFTVPLGQPEIMKTGKDVTLVTYGWNVTLALESAKKLEEFGIETEVIDVQTLTPFDIDHQILKSIKKTGKVVFLDEDFAGGGTAYMLQKVIEEQQAFNYLDAAPKTVSASDNRPAYGSDGEYFTKPNIELIMEAVINIMHEVDIQKKFSIDF